MSSEAISVSRSQIPSTIAAMTDTQGPSKTPLTTGASTAGVPPPVSLAKSSAPISLAKPAASASSPSKPEIRISLTKSAAPVPPTMPMTASAPAEGSGTHSLRPLPPGWYPDPGGSGTTLYWDGRGWLTATLPPPVAGQLTPVGTSAPGGGPRPIIWVLGIVASLVVIGAVAWSSGHHGEKSSPSSPPASSSEATAQRSPTYPNYTYAPTTSAAPETVTVPQQVFGTIVGTCDEGGSCGVKQREAPYNAAPRLYSNDLQDNMTVTVVCQTVGDVRSSAGHGTSVTWYRLDNGAYVNSVYMDVTSSRIPSC